MTPPSLAASRFLWGLAIGAILGLLYGWLRPPRRKHPHLSDLLFMAAAFYGWLLLNFGICKGDLRPVYSLALAAGILLEEWTLGRLLRPVIAGFWKIVAGFFSIILLPGKIFLKKGKLFANYLFATGKKWGTISWNHCRHFQRKNGGKHHVQSKEPI